VQRAAGIRALRELMMTADTQTLPMVVRADDVPGPKQGCWTYEHYAAIPDDGRRYEVIDGVLYMTPAPNLIHQASITRFTGIFYVNLELTGLARVFAAPTDVTLPTGTTVQPDIVVVLAAHTGILTTGRILGAPDLVVEILSPGTAGYDWRTKQDAYARGGVPEYWIADPYARTVEPLFLEGDAYRSAGVFQGAATVPSKALPDLPLHVEQFFA
jgi:Uma2 family endonuclease